MAVSGGGRVAFIPGGPTPGGGGFIIPAYPHLPHCRLMNNCANNCCGPSLTQNRGNQQFHCHRNQSRKGKRLNSETCEKQPFRLVLTDDHVTKTHLLDQIHQFSLCEVSSKGTHDCCQFLGCDSA
mmetsp:Transcript_15482/g.23745  ORF Transcript_15482/g.23745 Transcript_15482/m.23745 type:complete len:125 (+) Transcript_15482:93-467(+)